MPGKIFTCPKCSIEANLSGDEIPGWVQRHIEASPDCSQELMASFARSQPKKP